MEGDTQLVHTHQDLAYNVAYRLLGCADAASEATQEAILAACRALPVLGRGSFRVCLLRRVVEACRRRLRPGRHLPAPVAGLLPGRAEGSETLLQRAVEAGIARLPLQSRVVLVLADLQGLSYDEIGQVTGETPGMVGRRLAEARGRPRDWLYGAGKGTRGVLPASLV